ncbi:WcaI family glycosyltransferase [Nafulsella turpanensis]|uniref:WcaI family glycosyltransferase n=1 Tax=Nafulsella turpanensis TaxID=1265690 RepID=UPI0003479818|nr:WcaI family glycosyltransferase [Nafulsella turpanensis]
MIGYNFSPEPTGIGKYSGEMIDWLANQGYDCTVITTYPYYPYWKVQEPYYKKRYWYTTEKRKVGNYGKIKICRCPMYVPAVPSGLRRMILDISFLVSAFFKLLQLVPGKKFDYVITVVPSFQLGLLGVLYRKLRKAHFLYHIQDMQIEAARDLKMIRSAKVIKALFKFEKFIFNHASGISSISDEMVRKIHAKAGKEVFLFPNWTNISLFYPIGKRAELKKKFGFASSDKVILYSGAIGEKQGLESVLHAARNFQSQAKVKFLICGSGPYKEKLKKLANSLNLYNVFFLPLQPFDKFNIFLNMADVHLVIQKNKASDLVMPSKLTTILAVGGLAVVTANRGSCLHSLITMHKMGILVDAENQEDLTNGIRKALSEEFNHIGKNARQYAQSHLSIDGIMSSFESLLGAVSIPATAVAIEVKKGKTFEPINQEETLFRTPVSIPKKVDTAFQSRDRRSLSSAKKEKKKQITKSDIKKKKQGEPPFFSEPRNNKPGED